MDTPPPASSSSPLLANPRPRALALADGQRCLEAALAYLGLGWRPGWTCSPDHVGDGAGHSRHCNTPGKNPHLSWLADDVVPAEAHARGWHHAQPAGNVGVFLGRLVRLDYEGPAGLACFDAKKKLGLPATPHFSSGKGGGYLFRLPEGLKAETRTTPGLPAGSDFRALTGRAFSVLPPSRHPLGTCYAWAPGHSPFDVPVADAPAWLSDWLAPRERPAAGSAPVTATAGPTGNLPARARAYLAGCPEAVAHDGGHNATMKAARALVYGFDMGPEAGFDLLWRHYNPRCRPPWSEKELRHKCAEADVKPFDKPRGYLLAEGPPPPPPDGPPPAKARKVATAKDLIDHQSTIRWLWNGWIPLGALTILAATEGGGKTRLAADLLRRMQNGLPWPDGTPVVLPEGTNPVALWVASDNQHPELGTFPEAFGFDAEALYLNARSSSPFEGTSLDLPEELREFEANIMAVKPALVFVDTVMNATDRTSYRAEDAKAFYKPLMEIARRCGTSVVCVTHLNAAGKALGLRIRGQGRVVIQLDQPDETQPYRRRLWVDKSHSTYPPPLGVTMHSGGNDYDNDPPRPPGEGGPPPRRRPTAGGDDGEAGQGGRVSAVEACAAWLAARLAGGPARVGDLRREATAGGYSSKTLYQARRSLARVEERTAEGLVEWGLTSL